MGIPATVPSKEDRTKIMVDRGKVASVRGINHFAVMG